MSDVDQRPAPPSCSFIVFSAWCPRHWRSLSSSGRRSPLPVPDSKRSSRAHSTADSKTATRVGGRPASGSIPFLARAPGRLPLGSLVSHSRSESEERGGSDSVSLAACARLPRPPSSCTGRQVESSRLGEDEPPNECRPPPAASAASEQQKRRARILVGRQ